MTLWGIRGSFLEETSCKQISKKAKKGSKEKGHSNAQRSVTKRERSTFGKLQAVTLHNV